MASGTWFGEIPVCCCLTGSAWLCLDVSPNHVPEAAISRSHAPLDDWMQSLSPCNTIRGRVKKWAVGWGYFQASRGKSETATAGTKFIKHGDHFLARSCTYKWFCLYRDRQKKLSYSQAEPGREITQPSPRLLGEPCVWSKCTKVTCLAGLQGLNYYIVTLFSNPPFAFADKYSVEITQHPSLRLLLGNTLYHNCECHTRITPLCL